MISLGKWCLIVSLVVWRVSTVRTWFFKQLIKYVCSLAGAIHVPYLKYSEVHDSLMHRWLTHDKTADSLPLT